MTNVFFRAATVACLLATPFAATRALLVLSANEEQSPYSFGTGSSLVSLESNSSPFGPACAFCNQGPGNNGRNDAGDDEQDESASTANTIFSGLPTVAGWSKGRGNEARSEKAAAKSHVGGLFSFELGTTGAGGIMPNGLMLSHFMPNGDVVFTGTFVSSACGAVSVCSGPATFAFSDSRPGGAGLMVAFDAHQQAVLKTAMGAANANAAAAFGATSGSVGFSATQGSGGEGVALIQDVGATTAPEPASIVLFGTGLAAFARVVRRRFRQG